MQTIRGFSESDPSNRSENPTSSRSVNGDLSEETAVQICQLAIDHHEKMNLSFEEAAIRFAAVVSVLGCVELLIHSDLASALGLPETL